MADLFSEQSQLYAKYRPTYPDRLYKSIFRNLKHQRTAWDCGTGSGQVAGYLSNHFETVFASDISQQQMDHAIKKQNITYFNVPAENTIFPSDFFELITVAQAIHWFNFDHFYQEVNRTARCGALLAVFGYGIVQINSTINPFIEHLYEEAFGKYFQENREYINKAYNTIPFPFEEITTPSFKIRNKWSLRDLEGYFNSWSSIQKIKTEDGFNPADKAIKEIKQKIPDEELLEVTFPVFLRLGRIT